MLSCRRCLFCKTVSLSALLILSALSTQTHLSAQQSAQHHAAIEWYAELAPSSTADGAQASTVQTRATGKVTVTVDFPKQTLTFHIEAKDISGVGKIEVRTDLTRSDAAGSPIFTIYAHDGPFTGSLTKTVTGQAFEHLATPILNSRAWIVITTDKNPDREIAGKIIMHKHYAP